MSDKPRLAIVTQDPANYGGVLRLVQYIYARASDVGLEPVLLHYGRFAEHPALSASSLNLLRGELNLTTACTEYRFEGMSVVAIGAVLPEWEPNRIRPNKHWARLLEGCDGAILVTGSAHTGLPLATSKKGHSPRSFTAWVSSTVEDDRRERLANDSGIGAKLERASLPSIHAAERNVLQAAARVLAVSNDAALRIATLSGREPEVWPYPIDTDRYQAVTYAPAKATFLFVGRANDPRKRYQLFLRACEALKSSHPECDFQAVVVSGELPEVASNLDIVHHTRLDEQGLIDLYSSSTALVLTSEQEGLGIAAMEAMACGVPVISTRCGGPETFIEDTVSGYFVDDTPVAIAEAMFGMLDESQRAILGRQARQRIETQFSERIWNSKFDNMLRECVSHSAVGVR